MAKKCFADNGKEKVALGQLIIKLRKEKNLSLREFAKAISLSPSNLSYIENGTNVPTAEIYQKIINVLNPEVQKHNELDKLYTAIRKAPPPDICNILLQNSTLGEKIRLLENVQLSPPQLEQIEKLFLAFNINEDKI